MACSILFEQTTTVYRSTLWYCVIAISTQCGDHSRTCHQGLYHIQYLHGGVQHRYTLVLGTANGTAVILWMRCHVKQTLSQSVQETLIQAPPAGYCPKPLRCM